MYFEAIYILFLGMSKNSVHTSNGLLFLALCLELCLPFSNGSIKAHIYIPIRHSQCTHVALNNRCMYLHHINGSDNTFNFQQNPSLFL